MSTELKNEGVTFHCKTCDQPWSVPPHAGCPRCGPHLNTIEPDCLWEVSQLAKYPIAISAHLKDPSRLEDLIFNHKVRAIVDVAHDPQQRIVWRPRNYPSQVVHVLTPKMRDIAGGTIDPLALSWAVSALDTLVRSGSGTTLVHCAAGLRRAPSVVYAFLRMKGHTPENSWRQIQEVRPFVVPDPSYVDSVERWLSDLSGGRK